MGRMNHINGGFIGLNSMITRSTGKDEPEYLNSIMAFAQASAPTGWTKQTTYNDAMIRITNGTPTSGGSSGVSSILTNRSIYSSVGPFPVTIGPTTVSTAQMATHNHTVAASIINFGTLALAQAAVSVTRATSAISQPFSAPTLASGAPSVAAGAGHTHTGTSAVNISSPHNFAVKYMDVILAKY